MTIRPDWTFEATGLLGPQDFGHQAPEGWVLKEVRYGNRPVVRLQGHPALTDAAVDLHGEDLDEIQVTGSELDPEFLQRLTSNAKPLVLTDDESRTLELSISAFQ